jgi:hypothetical protein
VIAIEFEVWQNLRTIKAPFAVQAGLGLASGPRAAGTGENASAPAPAQQSEPAPPKVEGPPPAIGPGDGAASVEAVVKQLQTAALAGKGAQVLSVIYPTERADYAQGVTMAMTFMVMGNLSDEKASEALQKEIDAFLDKHKIKPPLMRDAAELFSGIDLNAYLSDALAFLKGHTKKGDNPADALPIPKGKPENVTVDGDHATAMLGGKEVSFSKIGGKWFIRLK